MGIGSHPRRRRGSNVPLALDVMCVACLLASCIGGGGGPMAPRAALIDEDLTVASRGSESVDYYQHGYRAFWPTWWTFGAYPAVEVADGGRAEARTEAMTLSDTATQLELRAEIDDRLSVIDARMEAVNAFSTPEQRIRLEEARSAVEADRLELVTLPEDAAYEATRRIDQNLSVLESELERAEELGGLDPSRVCRIDPALPLGRLDRDARC